MNETMSLETLRKILYEWFPGFAPTWSNAWGGSMDGFLYGHKIVLPRFCDQVVLFSCCEYCRSSRIGPDDCCASCGAPAYR